VYLKLSPKQKKWVDENKDKLSVDELSKKLKFSKNEIEKYIQPKTKKNTPAWFYIIPILIPILFFILLEYSLRIFNYGMNNEQWRSITEDKYIINNDISRRYFFTTQNVPYTIQDIFDKVKKRNAYRIFIMGESSTAGYPFMPLGSFSRYIRQRLELVYPNLKIEVVNIGMTAINSYTLQDLFPGVLEQKPDAVLIYTGHNEYFGALGVGSVESFGSSRFLVNTALYLGRLKTFEFLRDLYKVIAGWFASKSSKSSDGTLMSRIVGDQNIPLNSSKYFEGISQFEGNMRDILEMAKNEKVTIVLGTLICNLKDQYPFISSTDSDFPPANKIFQEAQAEYKAGDYKKASILFRKAKDLDALRFRAPEKINETIINLAKEFQYPVVQIDSALNAVSPNGIIGNNLMTDHLHPTLTGYQLIGKLFFESLEKNNLLPPNPVKKINDDAEDTLTKRNFIFTKLDSVIAEYRIKLLKNDWPFIDKKNSLPEKMLFKPKDFIDSTALKVVDGIIEWEEAQRNAAAYYLTKKNYASFKNQMNALIYQYPIINSYYEFAANEFLKLNLYDEAYSFLIRKYKFKPDAFSTKWLGIIDLSKGKNETAIKYLEESLNYDSKDSQVLYNLSGAYSRKGEYNKALDLINKCLEYNPGYNAALSLRNQLLNINK
jgi:tetratricopeptide (TPR) repeat protein